MVGDQGQNRTAAAVAMAAMAPAMVVAMAAPSCMHAKRSGVRSVCAAWAVCAGAGMFEALKAHQSSIEDVDDHVDRRKELPAELPRS